jgi:hypothetical protein
VIKIVDYSPITAFLAVLTPEMAIFFQKTTLNSQMSISDNRHFSDLSAFGSVAFNCAFAASSITVI